MRRKIDISAILNERGFTLTELLLAVIILVFVSVALMQTAIVNIEFNVKNALRDEGVRVAGETLDWLRNSVKSTNVTTINNSQGTVVRRVRNIEARYSVTNTASVLYQNSYTLGAFVEWQWKGEIYNVSVATVSAQPSD